MKTSPRYREWNVLVKREREFIAEGMEKKPSALNRALEEKVPDMLQDTLDSAFAKAFGLIFEKGTGVIEKTYNRAEAERNYKINAYTAGIRGDRKSLRAFSKRADVSGARSVAFSGVEGVGLGLLGIGLPDIPLFAAVMLRSVYETALQYGYSYESEEEKYFILALIRTSLSYGDELKRGDAEVNEFIACGRLPESYDRQKQIAKASGVLSKELLYMKFLQGLPVVGAVGGAYDAIYLSKVLKYAKLKYHRRFLLDTGRKELAAKKSGK